MATKYLDSTGLSYLWGKLKSYFQPKLVSGTNIKTINNESLLGSGNITIQGGSGSGTSVPTADTVAKFDNTAHMNSTDMTSQEVSDFVDGLNYSGQYFSFRQEKKTVSVPSLGARAYTTVSVPAPTLASDETLLATRVVVFDAAHQASIRYSNGWYLNVFNAYNGTASANSAEVYWIILKSSTVS